MKSYPNYYHQDATPPTPSGFMELRAPTNSPSQCPQLVMGVTIGCMITSFRNKGFSLVHLTYLQYIFTYNLLNRFDLFYEKVRNIL